MKRLLLLAVLTLTSCGSASPDAAQAPTIAPTALPPTPIALKDIDLEPLLIQNGDLPAGFSGAQIKDEAPAMFDKAPKPVKAIDQRLASKDDNAGGIVALLYETPEDTVKAYDMVVDGMGDKVKALEGVGEKASVMADTLAAANLSFSEGAFYRCGAVVHIRFVGIEDADAVEAYAKRLDKRLQASPLCAGKS